MSENGYSSVEVPPSTPGLPQNPLPTIFSGFTGLNTKASPQGIGDQQMSVCDGFMPLGPNNLRVLYDLGTAIYTVPPGRLIVNYGFGNIGGTPICVVCLDDGSLIEVDMDTLATTTIAPAATVTAFPPGYSQWSSLYFIIVADQENGYWLWDGTNFYGVSTLAPVVTVINGGLGYASPPTVSVAGGGGSGATFSAQVENGSVVSVTVTDPGTGYVINDLPILTFSGGGSDNGASANVSLSTLSGIASVAVNYGGYGYSSTLRVDVSGSATIPATLSVVGVNGVVTGITVNNPGAGYSTPPAISIVDLATSATGSGAILTAVMENGQIGSVNMTNVGSGYESPPLVTVIGNGTGAELVANLSTNGTIPTVSVVNAGTGYTRAAIQFNGGNDAAQATISLMPYGVQGSTAETYQGRVWVGGGRTGQVSAPGSPSNFNPADGGLAFQANESFLKERYTQFRQSNGFIYLFGDSSVNAGSGIQTSGNPALTTFNNLNTDPQIGTPWPATVQAFGRNIIFANSIGVYAMYGGAVTKVSDDLDGIYATLPESSWPAGFEPSAAVMTIYGIQVYILLMAIRDQVSGAPTIKALMWDSKRWWTSPQTGITTGFIASQEIDSVLTAYCSPTLTTIRPMFTTPSAGFTRYVYSKLWDAPGVWLRKAVRRWFVLINVNISDGAIIYIAAVTENGVGTEEQYTLPAGTGPRIIGPIANASNGKILGVRIRTTAQDIQINSATLWNNIAQSDL